MSEVLVRPADPSDAPALAAVHVESRRSAMPWLADLHDLDDVTGYMGDHVLRRFDVHAAVLARRVVGYVAVDREARWLEHLYLVSEVRRRGIGGQLLALAKQLSPAGLSLWTFQRNLAARAFYEARGFVLVATTDGAGNEEREPDARYSWGGIG